jgi:peptidyl-prolyl cis-trans isomerase B (cyclophilin B)
VTSSKRKREVARAKAERQAARRADQSHHRRTRNTIVAIAAVAVVVAGAIAWVVLSRPATPSDAGTATETTGATDTSQSPSPEPTTPPDASPSPAPSDSAAPTSQPDITCATPPIPRPDNLSWPTAPKDALKPDTPYSLTLITNCGDVVIETEPDQAPETVNSMLFLAQEGYFDLTACHRLTTEGIFVLQCGDPKGDGTGGPGYSVPDENLPAEGANNYPAGSVAMANAGPGTAGSQFFIVYEDTTLPSGYTLWGTVASGLDVVRGIAAAGVEGGGGDGPPAQPVVIETAKVAPALARS